MLITLFLSKALRNPHVFLLLNQSLHWFMMIKTFAILKAPIKPKLAVHQLQLLWNSLAKFSMLDLPLLQILRIKIPWLMKLAALDKVWWKMKLMIWTLKYCQGPLKKTHRNMRVYLNQLSQELSNNFHQVSFINLYQILTQLNSIISLLIVKTATDIESSTPNSRFERVKV